MLTRSGGIPAAGYVFRHYAEDCRAVGRALLLFGAVFALTAIGNERKITPEEAKGALSKLITANPKLFESPGKTESLLTEKPSLVDDGRRILIGSFSVDRASSTYQLIHRYGKAGKGRFEVWHWEGRFILNESGDWAATKPKLLKSWGR